MTEINEFPLNCLSFILLLLENEHVMIEELLQFLVGIVDTQLFKTIRLQSAKTFRDKT